MGDQGPGERDFGRVAIGVRTAAVAFLDGTDGLAEMRRRAWYPIVVGYVCVAIPRTAW